jgi:uncharacterized protein
LSLEQKIEDLHTLLHDYVKVAVAFSGGVDSSLLLKSALDVLGAGNVLVIFARSCLVRPQEQQRAESWLDRHNFSGVELQSVDLQPLAWKEFVRNSEKRCYHCKLRMYKEFLEIMRERDIQVLLDGTNTDDLKDRRPGLQAIHELGVKTPFVTVGMDKNEIRAVSRDLKLDTWEQPSSSCLATRIATGMEITRERLETVAGYEVILEQLGFVGHRVRIHSGENSTVYLQLQLHDFGHLSTAGLRQTITRSFQKVGVQKIYLDLEER